MKIAVIETGGKQYLVEGGQKIQIERLEVRDGRLDCDKVLLVADEKGVEVGRPYLSGKKVSAEILEEKRLPKVTTFKYHSKTRYRVKKGHRQPVAMVRVLDF